MAVRTLIIEDSIPARNALRHRLEKVGCEIVAEAGDAIEGLKLFRMFIPDLVTLDLMMPRAENLNAKSLFRLIRSEAPQVAVIVISSQPRATERSDFFREGAIAYFEKPFINPTDLASKLEQVFPELKRDS